MSPTEIKDFFGLYSGYLIKNTTQNTDNISIKTLKYICLEVMNGKSKLPKTQKTDKKER